MDYSAKIYETIKVKQIDNIGVLTLNRPDQKNRLNDLMQREMCDALDDFENDNDIRAIILNAVGSDFSAGADASRLEDRTAVQQLFGYEVKSSPQLQDKVLNSHKGTVVAIQGRAFAGGAGLAVRADITMMADDAQLAFTAIIAGVSCTRAIPFLREIVGDKRARELTLTARVLSAQEALDWGLANRVVPADRLQEEAMNAARDLASRSPLGVWFTKRAALVTRNMGYEDAQRFVDEHFCIIATSEDGQEGLRAFLEKRSPKFKFPYEVK